MKKESKLIHSGRNPIQHQGTVNPPIYQSSTIIFPDNDSYQKAEEKGASHYQSAFKGTASDPAYGISGTETTSALQEALMGLENADYCFLTSSGLSAITLTLSSVLKAGDHILITDAVYGPTRRFANKTLKKFGVEVEYYDPRIGSNIESLIKDNTAVIFLESPGSLTFEVQDIEPITKIASEKNITTIIDNSFATPLNFTPLDWGVDISIQAVTKFINGHADLLMGAILGKEKTFSALNAGFKNNGSSTAPFECYQALRGLRSLNARLKYQENSFDKAIEFLSGCPEVKQIISPALESSSDHQLWKKYTSGAKIPLFSVELDRDYSYESVCKMIDGYKLFAVGASWGGYESLVRHFTTKSIRSVSEDEYSGTLVRYYLGLEDVGDLIEDLKQGFERLK